MTGIALQASSSVFLPRALSTPIPSRNIYAKSNMTIVKPRQLNNVNDARVTLNTEASYVKLICLYWYKIICVICLVCIPEPIYLSSSVKWSVLYLNRSCRLINISRNKLNLLMDIINDDTREMLFT